MVSFFLQDIDFKLKNKRKYKKWLCGTAFRNGKKLKALAVVFCSDRYLLALNRRFLGHDYYTDVLTFDARSEDGPPREAQEIEGDVFVSIDTVRENAAAYGVPFAEELARVMVHGLLHLLGYGDATPKDRAVMRREEDIALQDIAGSCLMDL